MAQPIICNNEEDSVLKKREGKEYENGEFTNVFFFVSGIYHSGHKV